MNHDSFFAETEAAVRSGALTFEMWGNSIREPSLLTDPVGALARLKGYVAPEGEWKLAHRGAAAFLGLEDALVLADAAEWLGRGSDEREALLRACRLVEARELVTEPQEQPEPPARTAA